MSYELLYTSAPSGLKRGSRGFATVLCTQGAPANITSRLETLSGYRHVFSPGDPRASLNPVTWSHVRLVVGGRSISVMSRIADYGVDYSGRTNKLAHHLVLEPDEFPAAGPAWLLARPGFMRTEWDGQTVAVPAGPPIPSGDQPPATCEHWQRLTGDAGWGGVVAEWLSDSSSKPSWIIFATEQTHELLALLSEATALLSVAQRWRATFSTYYTSLPPEVNCKVRCVLAGSEEARLAASRGPAIHLTEKLPPPPESSWVTRARTGQGELPSREETSHRIMADSRSRGSAPVEGVFERQHPPKSLPVSPPVMSEPDDRPSVLPPAFPPGGGPPQLPPSASRQKGSGAKSRARAKPFLVVAAILFLTATLGLTVGYLVMQERTNWTLPWEIASTNRGSDENRRVIPIEGPQEVTADEVIAEESGAGNETNGVNGNSSSHDEHAGEGDSSSEAKESNVRGEKELDSGNNTKELDDSEDEWNRDAPNAVVDGNQEESGDEITSEDRSSQAMAATGSQAYDANVKLPGNANQNIVAHFTFERGLPWVPANYEWLANSNLAKGINSSPSSGKKEFKLNNQKWAVNLQYPRCMEIQINYSVEDSTFAGAIRVIEWGNLIDQTLEESGRNISEVDAALSKLSSDQAFIQLTEDKFRLELAGDELAYKVNVSDLKDEAEKLHGKYKGKNEGGATRGAGSQLNPGQSSDLKKLGEYIDELKRVAALLGQNKAIELDCGTLKLFGESAEVVEEIPLRFRLKLNIEDEE